MDDAVVAEKRKMRRRVIAERDAIDLKERHGKSASICSELKDAYSSWRGGRASVPHNVAMFYALGSEVDLADFARFVAGCGDKLCYPVMVCGENRAKMVMVEVSLSDVELGEKAFFRNPAKTIEADGLVREGMNIIPPSEIDFAVIPLVAFDDEGGRLGYGGGNYDEFLEEMRADACAMGAAFVEQHVEKVPREPHDRSLSKVVCG